MESDESELPAEASEIELPSSEPRPGKKRTYRSKSKKKAPTFKQLYQRNFPAFSESFVEMAWDDFHFDEVIEILLNKRRSFPLHKQLLFAALKGWMIGRENAENRRTAIRMSLRTNLARLERSVAKKGSNLIIHDLAMRFTQLGPDFYEQIYYPLGGINALSTTTKKEEVANKLQEEYEKDIVSLNKLMHLIHFWALRNPDTKLYYPVSQDRCLQALRDINATETKKRTAKRSIQINNATLKERKKLEKLSKRDLSPYLGKSTLLDCIMRWEECVPLCYAASLVMVNKKQTMLDILMNKRILNKADKINPSTIRLWLGYSAFLRDRVLSQLTNTHFSKLFLFRSLNVKEIEPPVMPLTEEEDRILRSVMAR